MTALACTPLGQRPAGRRLVQRDAEPVVAGRRHRRRRTQLGRDRPGQRVGAVMATQQRHHGRAILGDRYDRGSARLVVQEWRHGPDQDAARAQPHDRSPGREQAADMRRGLREPDIGLAVRAVRAVDLAAGQEPPQPQCQVGAARAQADDRRRLRHGCERLRPAMISEK